MISFLIHIGENVGAAALAGLFVVFYALGVSTGREAVMTRDREEDISMEHEHGDDE